MRTSRPRRYIRERKIDSQSDSLTTGRGRIRRHRADRNLQISSAK